MKYPIRVNTYEVMSRAIEEGTAFGWMRAHKHTDTPSEFVIKNEVGIEVMNAICEVFLFDGDDDMPAEPEGMG